MSDLKNKHWICKSCMHKYVLTYERIRNNFCPQCGSDLTFPADSNSALESITLSNLDIKLKSRFILRKAEINDFLSSSRMALPKTSYNRIIGAIGEAEAALLFIKKEYEVTDNFPIDLVIRKNDKVCLVDVKTTSRDQWVQKKYFHNKQRQQDAFGYSLDEYLRVKILLEPYRVIFNEEDLEIIEKYLE